MGVWDLIYSTTDTVKKYTPGLTSIKNASVASYGFCASASSVIDNAVRVNGIQKLNEFIPDGDRRAQIGSFAGIFVKNAAVYGFKEGYKLIPGLGGKAVSKIVSMTANDMKSENRQSDRETKATPKEKTTKISTHEKTSIADAAMDRKPEDVLRVFMMKEFIGTHFLDDLIVPGTKKPK